MISDVAVLYCDRLGPYPKLVQHWYDETRDARTYAGPWPVVAHPPCGPWSAYAHMTNQDPSLFFHALDDVRMFGGVLEHPAGSRAFRAGGVPHPGELTDEFGGYSVEVTQVSWGHACVKTTWLYCVGVARSIVAAGTRAGGAPTHVMGRDRRRARQSALPEASHEIRRRTPMAFAVWLVELARKARGGK